MALLAWLGYVKPSVQYADDIAMIIFIYIFVYIFFALLRSPVMPDPFLSVPSFGLLGDRTSFRNDMFSFASPAQVNYTPGFGLGFPLSIEPYLLGSLQLRRVFQLINTLMP